MVVFGVVALLVLGGGSAYVGWRLTAHLGLTARIAVWATFGLMFVLVFLAFSMMAAETRAAWHSPIHLTGFILLGLFSLLFAGFVLVDDLKVIGWVVDWLLKKFGKEPLVQSLLPADQSRRAFLANVVRLAVVGVAGGLTAWGVRRAMQLPEVVEVDIPIPNLPEQFEGFRIVQLTDIHVCPSLTADYVQGVVEIANDLEPDLVAVTGDLIDGRVSPLREDVKPLEKLASRHGTFVVTGNHEYYSGVEEWLPEFRKLGMKVLLNEHAVIDRDGRKLVLAGVTDSSAHQMEPSHRSDPAKAAAGAPEDAAAKVMLAHQPRSAYEAVELGFDLTLCGHTHGGQFFPWTLVVGLVQPFSQGLYRHKGKHIYTSRGTGYWGPPLRTGGRSEITLVRLKRA